MSENRGIGFGCGFGNDWIWWIIIIIIVFCLLCPGFFGGFGCGREN
ncbi:MAG: hypothetical protein N2645_20840 [Clostridia bacterium]|nr:hypothetical protein [Clostridia bacterium]